MKNIVYNKESGFAICAFCFANMHSPRKLKLCCTAKIFDFSYTIKKWNYKTNLNWNKEKNKKNAKEKINKMNETVGAVREREREREQ